MCRHKREGQIIHKVLADQWHGAVLDSAIHSSNTPQKVSQSSAEHRTPLQFYNVNDIVRVSCLKVQTNYSVHYLSQHCKSNGFFFGFFFFLEVRGALFNMPLALHASQKTFSNPASGGLRFKINFNIQVFFL